MNTADLLVVGAGRGQIPAIEAAQGLGLRVVVVDRDPSAPGMTLADQGLVVDVTDIDGVVRVARDFGVRGALTMQSDLPVEAVGAVNDALGLRGVTADVAYRCSNKVAMRQRFAAAGIPQPRFERVRSLSDAIDACNKIGYPCVVKAPDSSGSRGVARVESASDVSAAFREARDIARDQTLIVEEFIAGVEFGAQTFSLRGTCVAVHIHDDEVSDPPHMVPVFHAYPSEFPDGVVQHAESVIASAIEALGVSDGPANVDAILGVDGLVRIIEVGARIGATCLPELTAHHTGIDWVSQAVLAAMGEAVTIGSNAERPAAAYILASPNDGVLLDWSAPAALLADWRLLEWEVTAERGQHVSALKKGTDRIGKVVTTGVNRFDCVELARSARDGFAFVVR